MVKGKTEDKIEHDSEKREEADFLALPRPAENLRISAASAEKLDKLSLPKWKEWPQRHKVIRRQGRPTPLPKAKETNLSVQITRS